VIHDEHTAHWRHWFSSPETPNFFTYYEIYWSKPQDSKDDFMNYPNHLCIPINIREKIWNALTVPKYDGPTVKKTLEEATTRPITIEDLISICPCPFWTILYYDAKTFDAMTMIWETGQIPLWWKKKWLCPKAKVDPSLATLDDL